MFLLCVCSASECFCLCLAPNLTRKFGTKGSGDLQFNQPSGVSVDHELDRMRVADCKNKRIVVMTLRLKFVRALRGSGRGALEEPVGMWVDELHIDLLK